MSETACLDYWGDFVEQVTRAALREQAVTMRPTPSRSVVAFIDKLDSAPASVIAAAKECFVDGIFRGRQLPKNIFWYGAADCVMPEIC